MSRLKALTAVSTQQEKHPNHWLLIISYLFLGLLFILFLNSGYRRLNLSRRNKAKRSQLKNGHRNTSILGFHYET